MKKRDLLLIALPTILFFGCDKNDEIERNTCKVLKKENGSTNYYCTEYFNSMGYIVRVKTKDTYFNYTYDADNNIIEENTPKYSLNRKFENSLIKEFDYKESGVSRQKFVFQYNNEELTDVLFYDYSVLSNNATFYCNNGQLDSAIFRHYRTFGDVTKLDFSNIYVFKSNSETKEESLFFYSLADSAGSKRMLNYIYNVKYNENNQIIFFESKYNDFFGSRSYYTYNGKGRLEKISCYRGNVLQQEFYYNYGDLDAEVLQYKKNDFFVLVNFYELYYQLEINNLSNKKIKTNLDIDNKKMQGIFF